MESPAVVLRRKQGWIPGIAFWQSISLVLLLPLFYITHLTEGHPGLVSPADFTQALWKHVACVVLLFAVCRLVGRRRIYISAVLCFLLTGAFLFWGYVQDEFHHYVQSLMSWGDMKNMAFLLASVFVITLLFSRLRQDRQGRIVNFLILLQLLWLALDIVKIAFAAKDYTPKTVIEQIPAALAIDAPDVHLIIVDEYAGTNSLKANFDYDNSQMDSFLSEHGFRLLENSRANYNYTLYSLAAILNTNYIPAPANRVLSLTNYGDAFRQIKASTVVRSFEMAGYEFVNNSIFNVAGQGSKVTATDFPVRDHIFTANNFFYRCVVQQAISGRSKNKVPAAIADWHENSAHRNDVRIVRRLRELAVSDAKRPRFIYTHTMLTHFPYIVAKDDTVDFPASILPFARRDRDITDYLAALRIANGVIENCILTIQQHSVRPAIVVLMGDHGRRQLVLSKDTATYFQNLSAIYYPDKDYSALYDSMSGVNVFRAVMNKTLGTKYNYLKDSSVLLY